MQEFSCTPVFFRRHTRDLHFPPPFSSVHITCFLSGFYFAIEEIFISLCSRRSDYSRRSAHSAGPSRDLAVAGLFVSFSPFSVLGLFVVFEGLYVLWIGGGYVKRVLGYSVVLRTLWKVEILGNRPLGRCWGGPAFLGPPGSKAWTS